MRNALCHSVAGKRNRTRRSSNIEDPEFMVGTLRNQRLELRIKIQLIKGPTGNPT